MQVRFHSRRAALVAFAGVLAAPALAAADGAPTTRFRAIEVDVGPMRDKGDTITADWIAQDLPAMLRKSFAPYLAPGDAHAPVLRARVDMVILGNYGNSSSAFGAGATDWIEGAGIVRGRGGAVYPFHGSVQAHPFDIDTSGLQGRQRVDALAATFARWLPGTMGL